MPTELILAYEKESGMASKDTLYIEADDEIAAVIDRVVSAKNKVVAVVLPKRATVFQSAVNMKLLKKTADEAKKNLVVISSEESIMAIAGVAGVHVAKTLNSKPEIPKKLKISNAETTIAADELDGGAVSSKPTEVSTEDSSSSDAEDDSSDDDTIKIDNSDDDEDEITIPKKDAKPKFKIPDFTRFQVKVGLAVAAIILLITGWVFGFVILPKATITIDTDTSKLDVSIGFVAKTNAEETKVDEKLLKAVKVETEKTDSVTVPATGEKDVGERSSGTLTLVNCRKSDDGVIVPSGTTFSAEGLNYVTTSAVELGPAVYVGNNCISESFPGFGAVKDVGLQAAESGEKYNIDATSYSSNVSGVSAEGTDMTGGTTKLAKVVSAEDIKSAEDQLAGSSTPAAVAELEGKLADQQLFALTDTLEESEPNVKRSASQDTEAEELTVTRTVTYSLVGVSRDDIAELLEASARASLEDATQNIRSNGVDEALYSLGNKISDTDYSISVRTVATIGPEFDEATIKNEVIGKERGDIENMLEARDGVQSVNVEFSPFWIFQVPDKPDKITIIINEDN